MTNNMKPKNAVERLIESLEKRIKNYDKNIARIEADYRQERDRELRKISDAELQLKALRKK